jgi:hypothetical protein
MSPAFIAFRITKRHETSLSFEPGKSPSDECSSLHIDENAALLRSPSKGEPRLN